LRPTQDRLCRSRATHKLATCKHGIMVGVIGNNLSRSRLLSGHLVTVHFMLSRPMVAPNLCPSEAAIRPYFKRQSDHRRVSIGAKQAAGSPCETRLSINLHCSRRGSKHSASKTRCLQLQLGHGTCRGYRLLII
jgi:hypothetical protein